MLRPATGIRLELVCGQTLRIVDIEGSQVADVMAVSADAPGEWLSSGRTFDYNRTLFLTKGNVLYSNRSRALFTITEDTAGRHDFLFAPCSREMFSLEYGVTEHHSNCLENLAACFRREGLDEDRMPTPFNVFMHADIDPMTGAIEIRSPSSGRADYIDPLAARDVVVAVTACAAENTNGGRLKPIGVKVLPQR
ncbi:MAG: urea carboxylase-associated family protein [bacterium]|nr:urea carboxylase-associated family protein [bacterium]